MRRSIFFISGVVMIMTNIWLVMVNESKIKWLETAKAEVSFDRAINRITEHLEE